MDSINVMQSEADSSTKDKSKADTNMYVKGSIGKLLAGAKQRCNVFLEEGQIYEHLKTVADCLKASPLLASSLFAVLLAVSIPVVLFVLFAVVNVAFVVAGFIILEVTIFIIGATVLACSVSFVITAAAIIGISVLSFYLVFCYLITLLKKCRV